MAIASSSDAGGKGSGLLRLPTDWYPPTVVVAPEMDRQVRRGQYVLQQLLTSSDRPVIDLALEMLVGFDPQRMLLVRSSAEQESINDRGKYESRQAGQDLESVIETIADVWRHASEVDSNGDNSVGLLIQPLLKVAMSGHLSNEHRISRDTTGWIYEVQLGAMPGARKGSAPWRVTSGPEAADEPLVCQTIEELESRLRSVARRLSELPYRHHLEWVWDGDRLWIVQADRVPPESGAAPGDLWTPAVGRQVDPNTLNRWRLLSPANLSDYTGWAKTRTMAAFAAASLPIADVWALSGEEVMSDLLAGREDAGLQEDLAKICSGHVIVRTDLSSDAEQFMLDKSELVSDPLPALDFIRATVKRLVSDGARLEDLLFLAHRFLRARGCAWTLARPGEPFVDVDSTWGLPDGLSWLPHDSSTVEADTDAISRSINGKTVFLDTARDSNWEYRDAPTEWIWRSSVTDDQLRTLAKGATALANAGGQAVFTMWFIGLLDGGEVECLPWFQFQEEDEVLPNRQVAPPSERVEIANLADLADVESRLAVVPRDVVIV